MMTCQNTRSASSCTGCYKFKIRKSVHHHTIPINQPSRCNNFPSLLFDVYVRLNMFQASSRPSSEAQQLQSWPLVLPLERGGSSANKISQVYYLPFMYGSTCFGRSHAHHQELNTCSSSLWFYRWSVVVAVLPPRSKVKTRGCYCSC
jgi:hypothetical protein